MAGKVLITGANGFIGSYLTEEALRRGYEVWAGVRATGSLERLPKERIHCIDLKYDDPEKLTAQLKTQVREHGVWDFVIHNAGLTKTTHPADF
ncbi:MAG: SDR family NAD(P)-dependent oxidoreductase, partial [Tannerella sp.]|nr:SDR family NAD(P)-dependent oxidoreductase [Tannerella sp.]